MTSAGPTDWVPSSPPEHEPVSSAEWAKLVANSANAAFRAGLFGVDAFRYGIEQMHPRST